MLKLKKKRYIALLVIMILFLTIVGLSVGKKNDKYSGLVKVKESNIESKLLGSVGDAVLEDNTVKGNSTVEYEVSFTLDQIEGLEKRDAIIKASLTNEEFKYARFKAITGSKITSTLIDNGKEIEVLVQDVTLGQEKKIKLKLVIENAPNEIEITPTISVREATGDYTNLNTNTITVETNSVEGIVRDENTLPVKDIEVAIKQNGEILKKAYTNSDGKYTITDLETGSYELDVDEDNYEVLKKETVDVSGTTEKNFSIRQVEPYQIETHKYITALNLILDGKEYDFTYDDREKVLETIKKANTISGEINYKLVVKNIGEKAGTIEEVSDVPSEGLKLKEGSYGWEESNGIYYYRPIEGVTLQKHESREIGLTLKIESTSAAKTYINKMTTKGEIFEKVVYILDGEKYKEESVLEGDKIEEPVITIPGFTGWYTDKNRSNKYNFDLPVNKDLILYGYTEVQKYRVDYVVEGETIESLEIDKGDTVEAIDAPELDGKTFEHWSTEVDGEPFDFSTQIEDNLTLYGVYKLNEYTVTFKNGDEVFGEVQTIKHGNKATVPETSPEKQYYRFDHWSIEEDGEVFDFDTPITSNITLHAVFEIIKYNVKFINDGEVVSDEQVNAGTLISPIEVSKEGYDFRRWSEQPNGSEYDFNTPLSKDLTLYAVYEIKHFNVKFISEGTQYGDIETVDYNNTATKPTTDPEKQYYDFKYWSLTENGSEYDFNTPVKNNIDLYAVFEIRKYRVQFIDDGETIRDETLDAGTIVYPPTVSKTGYTFKWWSEEIDGPKYTFGNPLTGPLTVYSVYEINNYDVDFYNEGNKVGTVSKAYNTTLTNEEAPSVTKDGHTFTYWSLEGETSPYQFSTPITHNIRLNSNFELQKRAVTFNDDNRISSVEIDWGTTVSPIASKGKTGYTFSHWSKEVGGTAFDFSTIITEPTTLFAVYNLDTYTITYVLDGGTVTGNPDTYTILSDDITIINPTKIGYDFVGWTESTENPKNPFVIEHGSTGNKTLTAHYTPTEYTITYVLNGGDLEPGKTNPDKYYITSNPITLNNPSKTGYTFTGWNDGTETKNPYVINTGTTGDITLTAVYTPDRYTITYVLDGGTVSGNPEEYTIESPDITINNPTKTGYDFTGWTESTETPQNPFIIHNGSTGNKTLTAHYTPTEYTITYVLNGGDLEPGKTNPDKYYITSNPITLNNPSKTGYTFKGWTGTDLSDETETVTISTGSYGDRTYTANFEINHYTVTFMDGETQYGEIETVDYNNTATAPETNPEKYGYEFDHWSLTENGPAYNFNTPITDNIILHSVYTINSYTVTFMNGDVPFAIDHVDYNDTVSAPANIPTKAHNIFLNWTLNNEPYIFSTPVTSDLTLYSSFELVEAPIVTHTPVLPTWVRDQVMVTITSDHNDYTYYYRINDGTVRQYQEPFPVDINADVYAYSVKSNISSTETKHTIDNIDKVNPTIESLTNTALTPVTATIKIDMSDAESGVSYYKVYNRGVLVYTRTALENVEHSYEEEYTVTNLEELNDYVITVELFDNVGNSSSQDITVSTPAKHYVCRTVTSEDVEINKFESIGEALASTDCTSSCKIQMIDNTEESNDILQGKNVVLDINGYTITGTGTTAFNNYDTFQVIDTAETPGKIYSSGTGIYNSSTGTLTIGYDERPAPQIVSTVAPVVEGATYGIQSDGTLNFYDGRIIGVTTSVLGDVTDTPYLYNTTVKSDLIPGKEVEILVQLAEAEARIRSKYYTKVQGGVDDSKNGSYIDYSETSPIKTRLQHDGDYRFIYDEERNQVISTNQYVPNSIAHSYIKLDLTNYDKPQLLKVNAEISSQSGNDIGYVYITESEEMPELNEVDRLLYISGVVEAKDYSKILENGKTYYIHLVYSKNASTDSNKDWFIINDINLGDFESTYLTDLDNATLLTNSNYTFVKDQEGTLVSNNKGIDNSTASAFMTIDLTNVDEEKYIEVEASISSQGSNDYGYIFVTNSQVTPSYNNPSGRQVLISGSVERKKYVIKLIPNIVNFVHFGYYKNSYYAWGDDEFKIYSMKVIEDGKHFYSDGILHNKENYYFTETDIAPNTWNDLSNHGNDGEIVGAVINSNEDGFVFDGNDYVRIGQVNLNEFTWQAKFNATSNNGTIIANYEDGGAGVKVDSDGKLQEEIYIDGAYRNLYTNEPIEYGRDYVVTMTYSRGSAKLYLDGVLQDSYTGSTIKHPNSNTVLMLGAGPGGYNPDGNYFHGTIYGAKVFARELSDSEISGSALNDGLFMHLDATNYEKITENKRYISNNKGIDNSVANSYLVFDLTDSVEDIDLTVSATIGAETNYDYGYITVTDSPDYPAYNDSTGRFVLMTGTYTSTYTITLTAGRVNYLHMGYRKDNGTHWYDDCMIINYIKYYEDSDQTIPVYILGGESSDEISGSYTVPRVNQEVDTVQILRNITLTNPLEIVETRDVVLDLNGYTLTTSKDDYVVKNKGNLTVIDSKYETEKSAHHSTYEQEQAVYDAEYNAKSAENEAYIEELQEQYDEEYQAAVEEYAETGGASGGTDIPIPLTSDNFEPVSADYYEFDPIYIRRAYSGSYSLVRYRNIVNTSNVDCLKGSLSYWNDYGDMNIGKLIIGFATTNELRSDDFVSYAEYDLDSNEITTVDYNIPAPATPGDYYVKAYLYHNTNVYAYTVYMKINSMSIYGPPVRKIATDKVIENASNVYDENDYISSGLLVNLDAINNGLLPDVWVDLSGNNNDFTSSNVTNTSKGMKYNGSSSYSTLADSFSGMEEETVEVMFSTKTTGNQVYYNGNSNQFIGIGTWDGYIIVSNQSSVYTYNIPGDLANGNIHTISVTYGLGEYNAYYDGEPLTRRSNTNSWGSDSNTYIGRRSSGNYFNGTIYGVRIYDRELSSPEITTNYNVSIARYNYGDMKRPIVIEEPSTLDGNITSTTNSVILNDVSGNMNIRSGIINLDRSGGYSAIVNRGKLTLGEAAVVNAKQSSNRGITNTISGDIQDGSGTINTLSSSNIGILNESVIDSNIKGYKITSVSRESYDFYNNGEHNLTLDNMSLTGSAMAIYQNRDYDLTVNNSIVSTNTGSYYSTETYYSNESSVPTTVTFNNCDITGRVFNRSNSKRKIVVNDSTSTSVAASYEYTNFYNYDGTLEINNTRMERVGQINRQIIENYNELKITDSTLHFDPKTYTDAKFIYNGVNNGRRGNAEVINTDMYFENPYNSSDYYDYSNYGIYNYGDMLIDGGSLSISANRLTGIYNDTNATLVVKGDFELSNYIRGINNNGTLTLGDNLEPVSKTSPTITAVKEAINGSNSSAFNFYDGKLVGELDKALFSIVNDVPTNYDLDVEKNDLEIITLGPITGEEGTDVCKIGNTKYKSIQDAVNNVPNNGTQTEIELLKDIYTARTVEIPNNKNVLLNQKNFGIKAYKEDTYITNDGILSFTDDSAEVTATNSYLSNLFIQNNNQLNYDKVNTSSIKNGLFVNNPAGSTTNINGGLVTSTAQNKLIDNAGTLNVTGGKISETVSTSPAIMIDNKENATMTISGGTIEKKNTSYDGITRAINNAGTLDVTGGNFIMAGYYGYWKAPGGFSSVAITNNSTGNTTITAGASFNNGETQRSKIIENAGIATITGITSDFTHIGKNTGTMTLTDVTMNNLQTDTVNAGWHYGSQPEQFSGLSSSGTLTVTGGSYNYSNNQDGSYDNANSQGGNAPFYIDGGTADISSITISSNARGIIAFNSSTLTVDDSTIGGSTPIAVYNSTNTTVTDSTLNATSTGLVVNNSANYSMTDTDLITTNGVGMSASTTGNISIDGGSIIGTTNGINNTGASTLTIGNKDGNVSMTNPEITGGTIGLNNTNTNATINFYDGIISGNTAIVGKIADIESGYDIILETDTMEHKFLDIRPLVENTRTHDQYDTVQAGVDAASNGDTLQFLRENTTTPDTPTITVPSGKIVTIDLKGFKVYKNNGVYLTNNGDLTIEDSEQSGDSHPGQYIINSVGDLIENYGTLTVNGTYMYQKVNDEVIVNYSTGTVNLAGELITSDYQNTLVVNSGIMNISDGNIIETVTNGTTYPMIVNEENATMTITGGIIHKKNPTTAVTKALTNSGTLVVSGGTFYVEGIRGSIGYYGPYPVTAIDNTSTGDVTITGGADFNNINLSYKDSYPSLLIENNGTATIDDIVSNYNNIGYNRGTMTITNVTMENLSSTASSAYVQGYLEAGINNTGTLNINGGLFRYDGNASYHKQYFIETTSGTTTINSAEIHATKGFSITSNAVINIYDSDLTTGDFAYMRNTGDLYLKDSTVVASSSMMEMNDSSTFTIENSTMSTTSGVGINVRENNHVTIDIKSGSITSPGHTITNSGYATINIESGTLTSGENAINNTGASTITIGTQGDGTVSKLDPEINGTTVGLNNTNSSATINFYDGVIKGTTAIVGSISDVEVNYEIILDSEGDKEIKYLDKLPIVENTTTHIQYDTIQKGVNAASNGDTLLVLRQLTVLPNDSTVTIPSGKTIAIDLAGNKIITNNNIFIENNGTLTMTDSSTTGTISSNISQIFENNGTLTIDNGIYEKKYDGSKNMIINNGDLIVSGGTLTTDVPSAIPLINNTDDLSITGGSIIPKYTGAITSSGTVSVSGGLIKKQNAYDGGNGYNALIVITATGELDITNGEITNVGYGDVINNAGILTVTGGNFSNNTAGAGSALFTNSGTATITAGSYGSSSARINKLLINNTSTGNATISGIDLHSHRGASNSGTIVLNNINFDLSTYEGYLQNNNGTLTMNGGTFTNTDSNNYTLIILNNTSTSVFNNVDINIPGGYINMTNTAKVTFNGGSITTSNTNYPLLALYGTPTLTLDNGVVVTSYFNSIGQIGGNTFTGTVYIKDATIKSTNAAAINNVSVTTIVIGEQGGTPSGTIPSITGATYGLYNSNNNANIYFYDGIISGQTGSIYGTIRDVEPGYKEVRNPNVIDDVQYTSSTLAPIGTEDTVVIVNNTNFASLQSAINYAVANSIATISLQKDYALEADLVKPSGIDVNIYTNGHTLTTTGYNVPAGINIVNDQAPSGLGGAIYKFLANITGTEINPKNIIIYQMEDGTSLRDDKYYKLYELSEGSYDIVKFDEDTIGNYSKGSGQEKIYTLSGKLYLYGLGPGQYKLVGQDNKEIDFEIYENSVSDNILINNKTNVVRKTETVATLILTFGTGILRNHYILLILLVTIIVLALVAIKKKREEL